MITQELPHPLSVGFVLLHRFTLLPFAAFVDRPLRCNWTFMTSSGESAMSSCGAIISPCKPLRGPQAFDYIVVIGGVQEEREKADQRAVDYLRQAAQLNVPIIGLCTGVFTLIHAGLMTAKRCCVSWYHHGDLTRRFPDVTPVADRLFVDEGNLITCAGGVAAADVAAYLIERHMGKAWAMKSLHIMLIDEVLSVGDQKFKKKSYEKMKSLISNKDRTVVIVSHSIETLKQLCDTVMWMHEGQIKRIGDPDEVLDEYVAFMEKS